MRKVSVLNLMNSRAVRITRMSPEDWRHLYVKRSRAHKAKHGMCMYLQLTPGFTLYSSGGNWCARTLCRLRYAPGAYLRAANKWPGGATSTTCVLTSTRAVIGRPRTIFSKRGPRVPIVAISSDEVCRSLAIPLFSLTPTWHHRFAEAQTRA